MPRRCRSPGEKQPETPPEVEDVEALYRRELLQDEEEARCKALNDVFVSDCEEGRLAGVRRFRGDVDRLVKPGEFRSHHTALDCAAQMGNIAVCRVLVNEMGANVDQHSEYPESKKTPLHVAVQNDDYRMVKALVEEMGADIHYTIQGDWEALHPYNTPEVIFLAKPGRTMEYLVRNGVDPNIPGGRMNTGLLVHHFDLALEDEDRTESELNEQMVLLGASCWAAGVEYDYCAPACFSSDATGAVFLARRGFHLIDEYQGDLLARSTPEYLAADIDVYGDATPSYFPYQVWWKAKHMQCD